MFTTLHSKVTPFGGLHLIHKQLRSNKFAQFIDNELGNRAETIGYNYSEIILARIYTAFCGGTATEDINYIREHTLNQLKNFNAPSADTILRADLELATPCDYLQTSSGSENKININSRMNRLLIRCAKHFDILTNDNQDEDLVYDFDHQFIAAEKFDASYSY
jgi:hypothetical protein